MVRFLAHFLFILAAWTVVIKYLLPIGFALHEGVPLDRYIMWDLWWIVHIALGWSLLHWRRHTYAFALTVSVVEIVIIVTKFWIFLSAPDWTLWRSNWFINKVFVLACFVMMLVYLLRYAERLRYLGVLGTRGGY
jgi:hypothetical protein